MNRAANFSLIGVALTTVAIGVAINQVIDEDRIQWDWLLGALVAAAIGAYFTLRQNPAWAFSTRSPARNEPGTRIR